MKAQRYLPHRQGFLRGGLLRALRGREDVLSLGFCAQISALLLLPALHLFHHRTDHVHGPGGIQYVSNYDAQHANGSVHSHAAPGGGAPPAEAVLRAAGFNHGVGGIAHFAQALTASHTFHLFAAITLLAWMSAAALRSFIPGGIDYRCPSPRGPPA